MILKQPIRTIQSNFRYICEMNGQKEYKDEACYYDVGIEGVLWLCFRLTTT